MSKSKEKIKDFADKLGIKLSEENDGSFILIERSTIVLVTFPILGDKIKEEVVSLSSLVARGCRVDSALMSELLKLNVHMNVGAFGIEKDMVHFKYNILNAQNIDEDNFILVLSMVVLAAEEYGKKIVSTHGGENNAFLMN